MPLQCHGAGNYPTWIVYVQVVKPEEVAEAPVDIFDDTFTLPHDKYPLRPVGRVTLNRRVDPAILDDLATLAEPVQP
jgi:catalase